MANEWEIAKKAYEEKDYATAATQMEQVIAADPTKASPDAHYNLGMSLWALDRKPEAVNALTTSALHRPYSWDRLMDLAVVGEIQSELGIKESLPEWNLFRAHFALGNQYPIWMGSICTWLVLFALGALFTRSARWKWMFSTLATLALILGTATYGWNLFSRRHVHLAVIQMPEKTPGEVPLYRTAGEKEEDRLVELPAGTLVNIERTREGYSEINAPLVGWLPTRNLATLD